MHEQNNFSEWEEQLTDDLRNKTFENNSRLQALDPRSWTQQNQNSL